jgi:hypothetical protein
MGYLGSARPGLAGRTRAEAALPQRHRRSRLGAFVAAVCVVVGVILLAAPTTLSAVRGILDSPDPPQVSAQDPVPADTPMPTLSDGQQRAASELIARDSALRAILGGGNRYTMSELGPWTDEQGRLIGAAAVLTLEQPVRGERAWPLIRYDRSERTSPPYRGRVEHLTVQNATEIDALVDLDSGAVVSLQPAGERVGVAPGSDVVALPSAGD